MKKDIHINSGTTKILTLYSVCQEKRIQVSAKTNRNFWSRKAEKISRSNKNKDKKETAACEHMNNERFRPEIKKSDIFTTSYWKSAQKV
jgi:hypothetical protein